jgi:hypothetical protein
MQDNVSADATTSIDGEISVGKTPAKKGKLFAFENKHSYLRV